MQSDGLELIPPTRIRLQAAKPTLTKGPTEKSGTLLFPVSNLFSGTRIASFAPLLRCSSKHYAGWHRSMANDDKVPKWHGNLWKTLPEMGILESYKYAEVPLRTVIFVGLLRHYSCKIGRLREQFSRDLSSRHVFDKFPHIWTTRSKRTPPRKLPFPTMQ